MKEVLTYPIIPNNNYSVGRSLANLITDCVKRVTDDEKLSDRIIEEVNKELLELK